MKDSHLITDSLSVIQRKRWSETGGTKLLLCTQQVLHHSRQTRKEILTRPRTRQNGVHETLKGANRGVYSSVERQTQDSGSIKRETELRQDLVNTPPTRDVLLSQGRQTNVQEFFIKSYTYTSRLSKRSVDFPLGVVDIVNSMLGYRDVLAYPGRKGVSDIHGSLDRKRYLAFPLK